MMLKLIVLGACGLFLLTACSATSEPASEPSSKPSVKPPEAAVAPASTRKSLLAGRWVSAQDADTGFEPWTFFDEAKNYSDGNEEGTPYQWHEDQIIYETPAGKTVNRVIELTDSRFVEETEEGVRTVWTRAELE